MVTTKDFCDIIGNKMASEFGKSMIRNNFPPHIAEQLCDAIDRKDNADMFNRIMREYNEWLGGDKGQVPLSPELAKETVTQGVDEQTVKIRIQSIINSIN